MGFRTGQPSRGSAVALGMLSIAAVLAGDPRAAVGAAADGYPGYRARKAAGEGPRRAHKLLVDAADTATYARLRARGAVREEADYGSFKLLVVDEDAAGGAEAVRSLPVLRRDDQDQIDLDGYRLDTTRPEDTYLSLPAALGLGAGAEARSAAPKHGLYLVQFSGPIRRAWLDRLRKTGVKVVTYIPENAYVVRADETAAAALVALVDRTAFVQFVGDYAPAFRLTPGLRSLHLGEAPRPVSVVVQVVEGPTAGKTLEALRSWGEQTGPEYRVLDYRNVPLRVDSTRLAEIARLDDVFAVQEQGTRVRLDEAQGQILAGSLSGSQVSGPGYLAWLAGKGFGATQFGSFAVEVADDAISLAGHPDLPSSRVAFQFNPTGQTGAEGGHGFLNAHIVGGFNDSTGATFEDSRGFNYGLGIAPFARVGVTSIFGSGAAVPTAWESTAYGSGARISSNSWNYTGGVTTRYDANAQEYDRIVRDAQPGTAGLQPLIVVFAAGNSGAGGNTIQTPSTAKNVLTVGATENDRQTGTDGCAITNTGADSVDDIINFSSRGPINPAGGDGRVKPDIMAPGTHIQAGVPQASYDGSSVCNKFFPTGSTLYGWSSGTSHSTPAVAGGAALLYQDFLNKGRPAPSPAMVKAYLMNSATRVTGVGGNDTLPSNNQGMGRIDLGTAFDGTPRALVDQTETLTSSGQTYILTGTIPDATLPLRVTLAWSDAPGPTTGGPWVNNLDLEVTVGGTTYKGNVFSGGTSVAGGVADARNNVESVFLPAGTAGTFAVTVRATNVAGDGVPGNADVTDQDFALVVYNAATGALPPIIAASPASFSFDAVLGGANPPPASLAISNGGGDTLDWSAVSDQPWLHVAPDAGTAPSTADVSADIAGLPAGSLSGSITITAPGAANSPVSLPVTLTIVAPTDAVTPVAECVVDNHNGTFTARFGYRNDNAAAVGIPIGPDNRFQFGRRDRGQPTLFQPGTVENAFSVTFRFGRLTWQLRGPDGVRRSAVATRHSTACP